MPYLIVFFLTLLPFVAFNNYFADLFWFGDELDLLLQVKRTGSITWAFQTFAENFVPLFKMLWIGAVHLFDGKYWWMIFLLWLTHAVNATLIFALLRKYKIDIEASFLSALTFGLTWSVYESLGWSVQWSAVLATMFFILSLLFLPKKFENTSYINFLPTLLAILCSVLSFSRGVLTGLTCSSFIFLLGNCKDNILRKIILSVLFMAPAVAAAIIISSNSTGNHHLLNNLTKDIFLSMLTFGFYAFSLNPIAMLFHFSEPPSYIWLFFLTKILVIATAFYFAKKNNSEIVKLLISFLIFDLANSTLMGIGRYHTGNKYAMSSRYQYEFLVSFLPFLAVVLNEISLRIKTPYIFKAVTVAWLIWIFLPWSSTAKEWSGWRGRDGRAAFTQDVAAHGGRNGTDVWMGIPPTISLQEAYDVVREFRLR